MKTKRFVSTLLALLLICSLPLSAFAAEYDLAEGSVTVTATESGQTVTQGTSYVDVPDSAPVITQSNSSTPTTNTVTINAAENATANVTIQDVNIVISPSFDDTNYKGQAAVTINVADNATANVTLDDVRIDTENSGGAIIFDAPKNQSITSGYAAVQITGNGDVTLELDGENTVQSGFQRAGVEKNTIAATGTNPSSGNGELTITDENGTSGTLKATGGSQGSGIGGGWNGSGSNITITGSAEVTATGGKSGAGIGGGAFGSGSNITIEGNANVTANGGIQGSGIGGGAGRSGSDIIITESAKVTANGGIQGSGIGGGINGSGSENITITGSAEVTANGGTAGAGIGGGYQSTGSSNITVSQDAQVKAQGGSSSQLGPNYYGAGAAIGEGGKYSYGSSDNIAGEEVEPNTDKLTPNGKIEYYTPGADMKTADPIKTVNGTYVPPQDEEKPPVDEEKPDQPAEESAAEAVYAAPLYRVIDQDGKALSCKAERKDGVLTITVDADIASLTGKLGGIQTLKAQGIDTIVFVTKVAASTFALSDLLSQGTTGDSYTLTHDGSTVTFTLGAAKTDISGLLAKP